MTKRTNRVQYTVYPSFLLSYVYEYTYIAPSDVQDVAIVALGGGGDDEIVHSFAFPAQIYVNRLSCICCEIVHFL